MNQRKITTRKCAIYGKGMTRPAALVLARQHNEFNSIQRCTSFPEMVVPKYNSTRYRVFKQECLTFLLSSQIVSVVGKCDPIFKDLLYITCRARH